LNNDIKEINEEPDEDQEDKDIPELMKFHQPGITNTQQQNLLSQRKI
jgi:hypothetical protein